MSEISKIRVGISVGDPNGIGFEIILKTFEDRRIFDFFTPVVFAHSKNFIEERKKLGITTSVFKLKNLKKPDRKSTRLNSSHPSRSRMPSSA